MSEQFHNKSAPGQAGADPTSQQAYQRSKRGREAKAESLNNREKQYEIRKDILKRKIETAKRQHIYFHDEDFHVVDTNDVTDKFEGFASDHDAAEKPNKQTGPAKALEEVDIKSSDKSSRREELQARKNKRKEKKRNARAKHRLEKDSEKGVRDVNSRSIKADGTSNSKHKSKEALTRPNVQTDNAATRSEDIKELMTASPLGKYHDALIASIKRGKPSTSPQLGTQASDVNTKNPDPQQKEIESKAIQKANSNGGRCSKSQSSITHKPAGTKTKSKKRKAAGQRNLDPDDFAALASMTNKPKLSKTPGSGQDMAMGSHDLKATVITKAEGFITEETAPDLNNFSDNHEPLLKKGNAGTAITSGFPTSVKKMKGDTQSIHDKAIKEKKNNTSKGWETTGRFRGLVKRDPNASDDEEINESLAFSSHYLLERPKGVNIDRLNFQVQRIPTNISHISTPCSRSMQICSVVQGQVHVTLCNQKFALEENGMWRVKAGEKCMARNVDDTDAVIHITTVHY
ncbi:hypothetical protein BP5796_00849 [Coleophoma crateriformis]|uniref:Uncharacterized protein n=1 Tax=Coleophoma crateriformis TaxID=565419 RepID=A0A3D8T971_9HELO|nr:hypothetical protein BP5796_00849 [Coleophoma crateriformis]